MLLRYENSTEPGIPINEPVLTAQWEHIIYILRSYSYKNTIKELAGDLNTALPGFVYLHNVMYMNIILKWCKLFSESSMQRTRIKHIFNYSNYKENVREKKINKKHAELKQKLLTLSHITEDEYNDAVNSMTSSRDKFIAHCDVGQFPPMPHLDIPIRIITAYYAILRSSSVRPSEVDPWQPATEIFLERDLNNMFTTEALSIFGQIHTWRNP